MNSSVPQPKLQNVVVLRSFAIMMVVLYHCYSPWLFAWNWVETPIRPLYSFIMDVVLVGRMPLFVFVSGYLFSHLFIDRGKYQSFIPFLKNKFKRLLVPLLLFALLMSICLHKNYIDMIIGNDCYHLWFLKMLFLSFMICWMVAHFGKSIKIEIATLIASIGLMFVHLPEILGIAQFGKYYIFFLCGYLFYKYRNRLSFIYKKQMGGGIMLIYLLLCGVCAYRYYLLPINAYGDIIHTDKIVVIARYLLRPLMILLAFFFVDLFLLKKNNRCIRFFDSLNKLSYGIYLFHMLFLQLISAYLFYKVRYIFVIHYVISPILLFLIIFSLSAYLTNILQNTKWGKLLVG